MSSALQAFFLAQVSRLVHGSVPPRAGKSVMCCTTGSGQQGSAWECISSRRSVGDVLYHWELSEVHGSCQKCMEVVRSAWELSEVHGSGQKCMGVVRSAWEWSEVHGSGADNDFFENTTSESDHVVRIPCASNFGYHPHLRCTCGEVCMSTPTLRSGDRCTSPHSSL